MAYPPNWLFTLFSVLGLVLVLLPLPWHLQAWNIGTCAYIIYTALGCCITFVNSIVWNGRFRDVAPVWCDITTRIMMGLNVAIPVCMLCISRRLYCIATLDPLKRTIKQRRREMISDLCLCVLVPVAQAVVAYIPQGQRYVIYENLGCHTAISNNWVALLLVSSWPVILGFISAVYSVLNLILFRKRQKTFEKMLSPHHGLTAGRYTRLMFIAIADIVFMVPVTLYVFCMNAKYLRPWVSWEETHFGFNVIYVYPATVWQNASGRGFMFEVERYLWPFSAFVFFLTIGLTREARANYRRAVESVMSVFGLSLGAVKERASLRTESDTEVGFTPVESCGRVSIASTGAPADGAAQPIYLHSDFESQATDIMHIKKPPLPTYAPPPPVYYPAYQSKK